MRRLNRRKVWLVAVPIVVTAGAVALSFAVYRHGHESERVQRAADQLSTPAGWKLVGETKLRGSSYFCVVSCPHPEVTKVYRTDSEPTAACARIKAQITRDIAPPPRGSRTDGCWWSVPLKDVGSQARAWAYTETAAHMQAARTFELPGSARPTGDGTYVWVTFSGGRT